MKVGLSQGWRMVFWSLCNKGTGVSQVMKRSYMFKFIEELSLPVCRVYKLFFWWMSHGQSCIWGNVTEARVSLSLSNTSNPYSSKSLGLFTSQVVFPCFILNHILYLTQQLTPDEKGLCFGGAAVVLSSSFDNFLRSSQANCRQKP